MPPKVGSLMRRFCLFLCKLKKIAKRLSEDHLFNICFVDYFKFIRYFFSLFKESLNLQFFFRKNCLTSLGPFC